MDVVWKCAMYKRRWTCGRQQLVFFLLITNFLHVNYLIFVFYLLHTCNRYIFSTCARVRWKRICLLAWNQNGRGSVKSELRSLKCFKFHSGDSKHTRYDWRYPLSESLIICRNDQLVRTARNYCSILVLVREKCCPSRIISVRPITMKWIKETLFCLRTVSGKVVLKILWKLTVETCVSRKKNTSD